MGGGDLNMKKHFHPLTMENLERVWKAEEKKRLEEEKVAQLQSELQEERRREELQRQAVQSGLVKKKTEKLDWMYSHQTVNTDEYLLGRKIDKHVEVMKEDKPTLATGEAVKKPEKMQVPNTKELMLKISEDPLFLIKKQEEENRKQLAQNPIKMKKLKELLEGQMKEKKKKEKKKKRKKEKKRHQSDSEEELPEMKKRHRLDREEERQKKRKQDSEESDEDERSDNERKKRREKLKEHRSRVSSSINHRSHNNNNSTNASSQRHDSSSEEETPVRHRNRKPQTPSDTDSDNESSSRRGRRRAHTASDSDSGFDAKYVRPTNPKQPYRKHNDDFERRSKHQQHMKMKQRKHDPSSDSEEEEDSKRKKHAKQKQINGHDKGTEKYSSHKSDKRYGLVKSSGKSRLALHDSDSDSVDDGNNSKVSRKRHRGNISGAERQLMVSVNRGRKRHDSSSDDLETSYKKNISRGRRDSSSSDEDRGPSKKPTKHRKTADSLSDDEHDSRHHVKSHVRAKEQDSDSDSSADVRVRHQHVRSKSKSEQREAERRLQHKNDRAVRELDEDEMERKRQEMMGNAKWREQQRGANVKRYKEQDAKEESSVQSMLNKTGREDKARFIKKMQHESYSSSHTASVEDRIKRNIHSKQRTKAALDKKFTAK